MMKTIQIQRSDISSDGTTYHLLTKSDRSLRISINLYGISQQTGAARYEHMLLARCERKTDVSARHLVGAAGIKASLARSFCRQ